MRRIAVPHQTYPCVMQALDMLMEKTPPVIEILGGRATGKSTLGKMLTVSLLHRWMDNTPYKVDRQLLGVQGQSIYLAEFPFTREHGGLRPILVQNGWNPVRACHPGFVYHKEKKAETTS